MEFNQLPEELILKIFSYLLDHVKDIVNASCVCSLWQRIAEENSLWKQLCSNFVYRPRPEDRRNIQWKRLFVRLASIERAWFCGNYKQYNVLSKDTMALSPDGGIAVTCQITDLVQRRACVSVWDITRITAAIDAKEEPPEAKVATYNIHSQAVSDVAIPSDRARSDNVMLVVGSESLFCYSLLPRDDVAAPKWTSELPSNTWVLSVTPNAQRLVAASVIFTLFDVESGRPIVSCRRAHLSQINSCSISADGQCVLTGGSDRRVRYWDLRYSIDQPALDFQPHLRRINSVALNPATDRSALSTSMDLAIAGLDFATQSIMFTIPDADDNNVIKFVGHGRLAATGSDACRVRLWNIDEAWQRGGWIEDDRDVLLSTLDVHYGRIFHLGVTPDGSALLSSDSSGEAWLFRFES